MLSSTFLHKLTNMRRAVIFVAFCTFYNVVQSADEYRYKSTATVSKSQQKTLAAVVLTFPQLRATSMVFLDEFAGGQNYSSGTSFSSGGSVDNVDARAFYTTNGTCPPPNSAKTLKFEEINIRYIKNAKSYVKVLKDVELPLSCENVTGKIVSLKDAKQLPKSDCFVNNKYFENGEEFNQECEAACVCNDGAIGCVSRCAPYIADWKKCQRIKEYGECCSKILCDADLEKNSKCDTVPVTPGFNPPWAVEILTSNETHPVTPKTVCSATIINSQWLLTKAHCVDTVKSTKIFHPISLSDNVTVTNIVFDKSGNDSRHHLALLKVKPKITFNERLQEINLPWPSECPKYANSTCLYYTESFNGLLNGAFQVITANRTSDGHCSLQHDKKPLVCLKMGEYPTCPNLDGSTVAVERTGAFYLIGFLSDASKKYENGCDINHNGFRPMISICNRLSWIRNVTSADKDD